jgi:hypothetical protein
MKYEDDRGNSKNPLLVGVRRAGIFLPFHRAPESTEVGSFETVKQKNIEKCISLIECGLSARAIRAASSLIPSESHDIF